jgi:signal transduction histidine kinase
MPFVRAVRERRALVADDLAIRRRDGTRVELRAIARPVGDPVSHVVVAWFDVSREARAERARDDGAQRLARAQRLEAIGTLAAGMAHEFNNLILGVKLIAAEVAATDDDPKRLAAMQMVDDITERSAALTRSLLGFARRGKHRAMQVCMNDVVASLSELFKRTLLGVELTFELEASDRGAVVGDHAQLEHLVMSLVLHARDAVPAGGRVVVRTADPPGTADGPRLVVLEVKDDGPGVSADVRERSQPDSAKPDGGPGLSNVFAIVESHGGSVEVDAGLDGRGTTMRVVLPAAVRLPMTKPRTATADLPRGNGLVLVIDDDPMVRRVITGSLATLGYRTIEAVSGGEAVEIFRALHDEVRAVVFDMVMPGMTGKVTYQSLRAIDGKVPVLLMSGHTLNEQVQEILDLGVRSFISKPYSISVLAHAMAELLQ